MADGFISSMFTITISGNDLNGGRTFTAPRSFTVVGIQATNNAAGATTLNISGSTAGVFTATTAAPPLAGNGAVQAQSVAGPTSDVAVLAANADITEGETITLQAGAATVTKVILLCVAAGGGESITVS